MTKFKFSDKNRINSLPKTAGVYAFTDGKKFLYIGKAVNIRERVKNHFQKLSFKDEVFLKKADKIGFIETGSEIEALLLESQLIKKYQPKYNVEWKDDKNYFFVGITKEKFPRVFITHQPLIKQDSNETMKQYNNVNYIGLFVDGKALKQTLKILRKVFPYRTCKTLPKKKCLFYDLWLCQAPCAEEITKNEYRKNIKNITAVLEGKKTQVLGRLKKEMAGFSREKEYEKAAEIRDQIMALENVFQNAHILEELPGKERLNWQQVEKDLRKILGLKQKNIKKKRGKKTVSFSRDREKMIQIRKGRSIGKINRIEGYDVSNIQGKEATGSMVVFENGVPNKNEYRKFRIKIAGKPNDTAMLKEVLSRRLQHPEWELPQLILIDGGRAQFNVARLTIKQFNPKGQAYGAGNLTIKVIALAKRKNELFVEGRKQPVLLKNLPQGVANLILQIRDEAHRFAIKYHKVLRQKNLLQNNG